MSNFNTGNAIITFMSVHYALKFKDKFEKEYNVELFPVPRDISSSCGIAARIDNVNIDLLIKRLNEVALDFKIDTLYSYKGGRFEQIKKWSG